MEEKQIELSNRLFYLASVVVVVVLISVFAGVIYKFQNAPSNTPREITVSGEGKVYIAPDIATIDISVENEGKDIPTIIEKNTEKMNAIISDIKTLGIEEKDIKTTSYSLSPQYNWTEDQGRVFIGYKITNTILVKIRDFKKIGDVLSKATSQGATSIGDISFTIEDPEKAKQEARTKAIEQAKAKAEAIAEASGIRLGRILTIQEGYTPYYYSMNEKLAAPTGAGDVSQIPDIQPGQQELTVTVSLVYRVK